MDIVFGPQGDFDEVYLYVRVDALFAGFGILLTTLTSLGRAYGSRPPRHRKPYFTIINVPCISPLS